MRACLAILLCAGCATSGGGASARAFVETVYHGHDPSRAGGVPWDDARCPAFFSTRICELFAADRREAGEEVGRLDGDPLYDAQDFQISELRFADAGGPADRPQVAVTFKNIGAPRDLLLTLVRERGGWRIDDIAYRSETPPLTLSQILTAPR